MNAAASIAAVAGGSQKSWAICGIMGSTARTESADENVMNEMIASVRFIAPFWTLPRDPPQALSAQFTYPTMACGKKRDEFLVIGLASSRTLSPHGSPAANQEPSTV